MWQRRDTSLPLACRLLSCTAAQYTDSLLHCKGTLLTKKGPYSLFVKLYQLILVLCATNSSTAATAVKRKNSRGEPCTNLTAEQIKWCSLIFQFSYYLLVQKTEIHLPPFPFPSLSLRVFRRQAERRQNR